MTLGELLKVCYDIKKVFLYHNNKAHFISEILEEDWPKYLNHHVMSIEANGGDYWYANGYWIEAYLDKSKEEKENEI